MQYAITAALRGDRSHQQAFNAALLERAQLTADRLNAIPGHALRDAAGRVLRDAAGDAAAGARPTRTSCSACCATPASSWCTDRASAATRPPAPSASCSSPKPEELSRIYDDIADFTGRYLAVGLIRAAAAAGSQPCARPSLCGSLAAPAAAIPPESAANSAVCGCACAACTRGTELDIVLGTMDVSAPLPTDFTWRRHLPRPGRDRASGVHAAPSASATPSSSCSSWPKPSTAP